MSIVAAMPLEGLAHANAFGLPYGLIEGFGLVLTRTSAMLLATPVLGTGAPFVGYKVALVSSVSIVLYLAQGVPLVETAGWVEYGVLVLRELVLGLGLAFLLHIVTMAVRIGSEMVGNEMAFTMANAVDPASGESLPLLSRMNETLFFLALLAMDGHHWILRALAESYERAPVGGMAFGEELIPTITAFFSQLFSAGVAFVAPVLVLLMMVSVLIGLIARAVPQVNVLEMGFSLRVAGGLTALALLSPTLSTAMGALLQHFMNGLEAGLDAIEV